MEIFNIWENTDPLVKKYYREDNYKIVDYNNTNICYIFFSSNGIYYPNTRNKFEEMIFLNRFEWDNLAKVNVIKKNSGRQIFVRDIFKQWYVEGINEKINSIDKLIEKLRELSKGMEIITVGSSAGGYVAALVAAKLNAQTCYDFCGQVNLYKVADNNPFLKRNLNNDIKNKYYNIYDLIKGSSCQFYYFYAMGCKEDLANYMSIGTCGNVYGYGFKTQKHASTMYAWNKPYILAKNKREMNKIFSHYGGGVYAPCYFRFIQCHSSMQFFI